MRILNVKLMLFVFIVQMTFANNSIAGLIGPKGWGGDNIDGFLAHGAFPGIEISVTTRF